MQPTPSWSRMNSETPEARNPVVDLEDDRRQMLDATTKQYRSHIDEGKHSTTSRKGDVPLQRRDRALSSSLGPRSSSTWIRSCKARARRLLFLRHSRLFGRRFPGHPSLSRSNRRRLVLVLSRTRSIPKPSSRCEHATSRALAKEHAIEEVAAMDLSCSDETDTLTHSIITIESKCSWVRYRSHSCCCLVFSRRSGRRMRRISEHDPFQVQERSPSEFGPSHISRLHAVRSRCEDHRSARQTELKSRFAIQSGKRAPHIVAIARRSSRMRTCWSVVR